MNRIRPKQSLMCPDGPWATRDELADFDRVEWIDGKTREIIERFAGT